MRTRIAAAVMLAIATSVTACTAQQDAGGDKAGGDPEPVVLRLGTPEIEGTPGMDIVGRFVAAVENASEGAVTVEVTSGVGLGERAWDQASIEALTSGEYDLALIPARAWHSEGVSTLEALQLPTLIETDEQADRVAGSSAVPALLSGLDSIGLTGLGLYPEGLRHIVTFGATEPFTAGTLHGKIVRAPRADTPWATIRALGGTPVDLSDFADEVAAGTVHAAESSLALLGTLQTGRTQVMTANVSLYYKFQVLAARTEVLDASTQQLLMEAAATAASVTLADRPTEEAALQAACDSGHGVVLTLEPDLADVREVMHQTVDAALENGTTARLVSAVRQAAGDASPTTLNGCADQVEIDSSSVEPLPGDLPDGVYRIEVTDAMLLDAGMPASDVPENHGVYTFTLSGGRYSWNQKADNVLNGATEGTGVYEVHGDRLTWLWGTEMGNYAVALTWSVRDDGALVLQAGPDHLPGDFSVMRLGPLVRID